MRLPISDAVKVAKDMIVKINTVQEWAEEMGFTSCKYFSHVFRNHYGIRPKEKLIQFRVELFFSIIKEQTELNHYEIALSMGLKDEKALNKFIKRYTGEPPSRWKNREI